MPLTDLSDSLVAILFLSGLMNAVLVILCIRMTVENQKLRYQLFQRERWHDKQLKKWRERL